MVVVVKPQRTDILAIRDILNQWTKKDEVVKYIKRIENEIEGKTEYNMAFWVAKDDAFTIGVGGLSDPLPEVIPFAETKKPGEIKILYVDSNERSKGVGKSMVNYFEKEAVKRGYKELLIRSAERYRDTAYGFYQKIGYVEVGKITENENGEYMQVFGKVLN